MIFECGSGSYVQQASGPNKVLQMDAHMQDTSSPRSLSFLGYLGPYQHESRLIRRVRCEDLRKLHICLVCIIMTIIHHSDKAVWNKLRKAFEQSEQEVVQR